MQVSDLVVLSNRDGHFMYIRPDVPRPDANEVISDVTRSQLRAGLRVNEEVQYGRDVLIENVSVSDAFYGIVHTGSTNDRVENFNFRNVQDDPLYGAALFRTDSDQGGLSYLRVYADGGVSPMEDESGYSQTNTDFFNSRLEPENTSTNEYVMMRDVTAKNFSDSLFDTKSTVYIMNATLENAFRLLRPWRNTEIVLVNCEVNLGPEGSEYVFFNNYSGKIRYYNTTWDGESRPNYNNISYQNIDSRDFVNVYKNNIIELDSNPLAGFSDFFAVDTNRYRAQVSVNGDVWRELALPEDGWLGRHIGDTAVELPDLGNGVYRVRSWTVDGTPTAPVVSAPIVVTTSSFNYAPGGSGGGSLSQPFATTGTAAADRLRGDAAANTIVALAGDDTVTGAGGADVVYGEAGDDLLSGGDGNDTLFGGSGDDIAFGGAGNDILLSGSGRDTLVGGDGSDTADFRYKAVIGGGGYVIDMARGFAAARSASGTAVDVFTAVENVVDSAGDDRVLGNGASNRLTSVQGDDTITGGGGLDYYIFDNRVDIGSDRITDFTWGREIWLTHYTDLGSDRAVALSGGRFWVDVAGIDTGNVQGDRAIDIGTTGSWFRYVGQNAEGYFVYTWLGGTKPSRDVLPTEQYDGAMTGPRPLPSPTPPSVPPLTLERPPANLPDSPDVDVPDPIPPVVEVFVAGLGGPTVGPAFSVYADGVLLGSGRVANPVPDEDQRLRDFDYERFTFAYGDEIPSNVEVRFTNDGTERNGVNRDLIVDRIVVAGAEFKTILDSVYIPDNPDNRGLIGPTSRAIWNGKFVYDTTEARSDADAVLRVVAAGTGFGADTPDFTVKVDGVVIGAASIAAPVTNDARRTGDFAWETFQFELPDASPSRIEITFDNNGIASNGEDLNLVIDKILVGDRAYEAEVDGFYTPDNPARWPSAGSTSNMFWDGVMAFDLA
jgi:Ca2+-binding RTX toxin-like protein